MAPSQQDHFVEAGRLLAAGQFAQAAAIYAHLAKSRPAPNVAVNLSICLRYLHRYDEALRWARLAVAGRPADPVLHLHLGLALMEAGQTEAAERSLRRAIALNPQTHEARVALANILLADGRWSEGWPHFEVRIRVNPANYPTLRFPCPEWRGEPLAGKRILVLPEQGFGDQIQMARFVKALKARGAGEVILGTRSALVALFAAMPEADTVIPVDVGQQSSLPNPDFWIRCFSLPAALGTTLEDLPAEPYLAAPAERRLAAPPKSRVGFMAESSRTGFNTSYKNMPPELAQLFLDRGVVSLRPEDSGAKDFADTAAIIDQLDLVITIDTAVAHLAGAMGKPCWTILPGVNVDWRWMHDRTDSPWYPSMRLYRQKAQDGWEPVVREVLEALDASGLVA